MHLQTTVPKCNNATSSPSVTFSLFGDCSACVESAKHFSRGGFALCCASVRLVPSRLRILSRGVGRLTGRQLAGDKDRQLAGDRDRQLAPVTGVVSRTDSSPSDGRLPGQPMADDSRRDRLTD